MGMNNEAKIPETQKDYLKEVVEEDFEKIQKGELTYDEAVTSFKKCNRLICKTIFGWLITPKEEELLNMKYAEKLKKLLDKASEDSKPEEAPKGEAEVELDFYINQCAVKSLAFMVVHGDEKLAAAMASGYTAALIDAGILKNTKEAQREFVNAVAQKAGM